MLQKIVDVFGDAVAADEQNAPESADGALQERTDHIGRLLGELPGRANNESANVVLFELFDALLLEQNLENGHDERERFS